MTKQADKSVNFDKGTVTVGRDDFYWFRHQLILSKKSNLLELNEQYVQENKELRSQIERYEGVAYERIQ